jgi:hypothetical protein
LVSKTNLFLGKINSRENSLEDAAKESCIYIR